MASVKRNCVETAFEIMILPSSFDEWVESFLVFQSSPQKEDQKEDRHAPGNDMPTKLDSRTYSFGTYEVMRYAVATIANPTIIHLVIVSLLFFVAAFDEWVNQVRSR